MLTNTSKIETNRASSYLQQLCKHFSHKVDVQFDPEAGQINLPFGKCELSATATDLTMVVSAENQADLSKAARVISSHLERFAFRENPKIEWYPAADHEPD